MPSRDEVSAAAREHLGSLRGVGVREWGMLARLLDADERIEAMALGKLTGGVPIARQRIVVATDRRLWFVEKGFVTGRERVDALEWPEVVGVDVVPPSRVVIRAGGARTFDLSWMNPPQVGPLTDAIRSRTEPRWAERTSAAELQELARRKLGRLWSVAAEPHVIALVGALEPGETVLELAWVSQKPDGLLAATPRRVAFVPSAGIRTAPVESLDYAEGGDAALGDDGVLTLAGRRFAGVSPLERAASLAQIVQARTSS